MTKENTSSSPSSKYYTLWNCIAKDKSIYSTDVVILSLPLEYGFVNERWRQAMDLMLEKKRVLIKIHQLIIIGLIEEYFNTALKLLFSKKIIRNEEHIGISE